MEVGKPWLDFETVGTVTLFLSEKEGDETISE